MDVPLEIGTWRAATRRIYRHDGQEVELTPTESRLLTWLAERPEVVHTPRDLLTHVWEVSAKVESRTVYVTAHRLRQKIERDPENPRHLLAIRGGYRFLPLQAVPPVRVDGTRVWGRDSELAWLRERRAARRLLITGPGGIGKTMLLRAAHAENDGVWIPASDATDLATLVAAVQRALGVSIAAGDPAEQVTQALAARGAVTLYLDNLEQAAEPARTLLDRWYADAPDARVIATSRVRLRAQGEEILALDALAVPPEGAPVTDVAAWPGLALFVERATRARPSLGDDSAMLPAAAAITRAVDGVPVCLELAAARVRHLPLDAILANLPRRPEALLADPDSQRPRHGAIRDLVAWSLALLPPGVRGVAAALSLLRGPFSFADAEAVAGDAVWVGDALAALVDHSLLRMHGGDRYSWLASIRVVLVGELAADDPARARHARHFARFGDEEAVARRMRVDGAEARAAARDAVIDLDAALSWAIAEGPPADLVRLSRALVRLLGTGIAVPDFPRRLSRARTRADLPPDVAVELAAHEAEALNYLASPAEALQLTTDALAAHPAVGALPRYRAALAQVLSLRMLRRTEGLNAALQVLVDTEGPACGPSFAAEARLQRGITLAEAGAAEAAEADLQAALHLTRAHRCDLWTSLALGTVAYLRQQRGALAEARAIQTEALALAEGCENVHRAQIERVRLATIAFMEGRFRQAIPPLEEARRTLVRAGLVARAVHIRVNLAMCRWMNDGHDEALRELREVQVSPAANAVMRGTALMLEAAFAFERGDLPASRVAREAALAAVREHGLDRLAIECARLVVSDNLLAGEMEAAITAAREGVEVARRIGEPPRLALVQMALAEALAVAGHAREAAEQRDNALSTGEGVVWAEAQATLTIGDARVSGLVGERARAFRAADAAERILESMEIGPRCYLWGWLERAKRAVAGGAAGPP